MELYFNFAPKQLAFLSKSTSIRCARIKLVANFKDNFFFESTKTTYLGHANEFD